MLYLILCNFYEAIRKQKNQEEDATFAVGESLLESNLENKYMDNGLFKLDWANIKSAIIYGLLTMAVVFVLSVAEGIYSHGSFIGIDWAHLVDAGGIKSLGIFVAAVSIIKNLLTTDKGKFLGAVTVIPNKTN